MNREIKNVSDMQNKITTTVEPSDEVPSTDDKVYIQLPKFRKKVRHDRNARILRYQQRLEANKQQMKGI
jgi:hypothetical protein